MPRTIETILYQYQELSPEAQERAIEQSRYGQVDYDWWGFCYEDAERIGAKIGSFALDRQWTIDLDLQGTVGDTVQSILAEHGKTCDTFELAREYFRRKHIGSPMDVAEFTQQLGECYLSMLDREYDYLTGDEAVAESLTANEMEFTESGESA